MEQGPSLPTWQLTPELREIFAQHRNPVPKEEDLEGNLDRVISLSMTFIGGRNEFESIHTGIAVPGMKDLVIPPQHEAKRNADDEIFFIPFPPPRPQPYTKLK